MSKPQQSNQPQQKAPEPPKATDAGQKPPEQAAKPDAPVVVAEKAPEPPKATDAGADAASGDDGSDHDDDKPECPACLALNGERPCSLACFVAAGYPAEQHETQFGAPAIAEEEAEKPFKAPAGKVHCKAITTCLVRGMPEFAGAEFWLEPHEAERLEAKGALEIVK
jgi:hypothetical protein